MTRHIVTLANMNCLPDERHSLPDELPFLDTLHCQRQRPEVAGTAYCEYASGGTRPTPDSTLLKKLWRPSLLDMLGPMESRAAWRGCQNMGTDSGKSLLNAKGALKTTQCQQFNHQDIKTSIAKTSATPSRGIGR